jgi:hypothetical protein
MEEAPRQRQVGLEVTARAPGRDQDSQMLNPKDGGLLEKRRPMLFVR